MKKIILPIMFTFLGIGIFLFIAISTDDSLLIFFGLIIGIAIQLLGFQINNILFYGEDAEVSKNTEEVEGGQ